MLTALEKQTIERRMIATPPAERVEVLERWRRVVELCAIPAEKEKLRAGLVVAEKTCKQLQRSEGKPVAAMRPITWKMPDVRPLLPWVGISAVAYTAYLVIPVIIAAIASAVAVLAQAAVYAVGGVAIVLLLISLFGSNQGGNKPPSAPGPSSGAQGGINVIVNVHSNNAV